MNRRTAIQGLLGGLVALFVGRRAEAAPQETGDVVEFVPIQAPTFSWAQVVNARAKNLWDGETRLTVQHRADSWWMVVLETADVDLARATHFRASNGVFDHATMGPLDVVDSRCRVDYGYTPAHAWVFMWVYLSPERMLETATGADLDELARRAGVRRLPLRAGDGPLETDYQLRVRLQYLAWIDGRATSPGPGAGVWNRSRALVGR